MRLSRKAKRLFEIIMLSGLDALTLAANPKSIIYDAVGWSNSHNAKRHLTLLQERGLLNMSLERASGCWVAQLTQQGKGLLLDGIDPEKSWGMKWDGKWISFSFDLPRTAVKERKRLDVWLKKRRFGNLQGSLWITHRSYSNWTEEIEGMKVDPRAFIWQQIIPIGKMKSVDYAAKAWSFTEINRRYTEYIRFLEKGDPASKPLSMSWFERESKLWNDAFETDPFLPNALLPASYKGKLAWKQKKRMYAQLGHKLAQDL